jgi:hypothetical protein
MKGCQALGGELGEGRGDYNVMGILSQLLRLLLFLFFFISGGVDRLLMYMSVEWRIDLFVVENNSFTTRLLFMSCSAIT